MEKRALALASLLVVALWTLPAEAADPAACAAYSAEPVAMKDPALCAALEAKVRKPSALPFGEYKSLLNTYSANFCHRNAAAGWVHDKFLRLSGPRVATLRDGQWTSKNFGTHAPVLVWYSPEMAEWLRTWRPEEGVQLEGAPPPPDGGIIVKEMFASPTSGCRDVPPEHLFPSIGGATMVRDSAGSRDGWFFGFFQNEPYHAGLAAAAGQPAAVDGFRPVLS